MNHSLILVKFVVGRDIGMLKNKRRFTEKVQNERGYTLVLVLLSITLIFAISAVLMANNLNLATQVRATDEQRQAVSLAEMGIQYTEATIRSSIEDIIGEEGLLTDLQGENGGDVTPLEQRLGGIFLLVATPVYRGIPILLMPILM